MLREWSVENTGDCKRLAKSLSGLYSQLCCMMLIISHNNNGCQILPVLLGMGMTVPHLGILRCHYIYSC